MFICMKVDEQTLLTPGAAAKMLQIAPAYLRELSLQGAVTASVRTKGGHRRYTASDIERAREVIASGRHRTEGHQVATKGGTDEAQLLAQAMLLAEKMQRLHARKDDFALQEGYAAELDQLMRETPAASVRLRRYVRDEHDRLLLLQSELGKQVITQLAGAPKVLDEVVVHMRVLGRRKTYSRLLVGSTWIAASALLLHGDNLLAGSIAVAGCLGYFGAKGFVKKQDQLQILQTMLVQLQGAVLLEAEVAGSQQQIAHCGRDLQWRLAEADVNGLTQTGATQDISHRFLTDWMVRAFVDMSRESQWIDALMKRYVSGWLLVRTDWRDSCMAREHIFDIQAPLDGHQHLSARQQDGQRPDRFESA